MDRVLKKYFAEADHPISILATQVPDLLDYILEIVRRPYLTLFGMATLIQSRFRSLTPRLIMNIDRAQFRSFHSPITLAQRKDAARAKTVVDWYRATGHPFHDPRDINWKESLLESATGDHLTHTYIKYT